MTSVFWRAELISRIDAAIILTKKHLVDPRRPEPNIGMLQTTLDVLQRRRQDVIDCHVPPPDGQTTLGIARSVLDYIHDLQSPLIAAVGAIEECYLTIPDVDQFPCWPDFSSVQIRSDGTTIPPIADGQAIVQVYSGVVTKVGIWRRDVAAGRLDTPINEMSLCKDVLSRLEKEKSEALRSAKKLTLICPPDLTRLMVWPSQNFPLGAGHDAPDVSTSHQRFLTYWNALYPETPPIHHFFKHRLSNRWARIHSLPEAKRYADTKAEWDELEQRQNAVIDSLVPRGAQIRIVINLIEIDNFLFKAFNLENIGVFVDQDGETVYQSFQFFTTWESHSLNSFLNMIAEEQLRAFIIGPDCLIAPYDGGMDLILKDVQTCWAFKRKFKNWLSSRLDGL
jgi:hypothetical protein